MRFELLEHLTPYLESKMKSKLSDFESKRNLYFKKLILEDDFKQNLNDFKHRNVYDHFLYKLVNTQSGRKQYYKNFIIFM